MRNEEYGQDVADIIVSEMGHWWQRTSGMDLMKSQGSYFRISGRKWCNGV